MSGYKIVRDSAGKIVAYGPNHEGYDPSIATGQTLEIVADFPEEILLENARNNQRIGITRDYKLVAESDVIVDGVLYRGGKDQLLAIDLQVRMAKLIKKASTKIQDKGGKPKSLTIAKGEAVVLAIADAYLTATDIAQSKLVEIDEALTLAEIKAVVW